MDHPRGCGEKPRLALGRAVGPGSSPRVRGKEAARYMRDDLTRIIPAGAGKRCAVVPCVSSLRDHPRGCGEKRKRLQVTRDLWGSSPRVRGKDPQGDPPPTPHRDHPRGCGEKSLRRKFLRGRAGSSPRVRGKDDFGLSPAEAERIIPAGAGKRLRVYSLGRRRGDHPRGCGEKCGGCVSVGLYGGSSPRVRGKGPPGCGTAQSGWIIPAGAGKSHPGRQRTPPSRDHPRGCGEKAANKPLTKI